MRQQDLSSGENQRNRNTLALHPSRIAEMSVPEDILTSVKSLHPNDAACPSWFPSERGSNNE